MTGLVPSGAIGAAENVEPFGDPEQLREFSFRFRVPDPEIVEQPDGFANIDLEGFGTHGRRPGAPNLPTRTLLIAIPPMAEPRLEVRVVGERLLTGIRPRPVAHRVLDPRTDPGVAELDPVSRAQALSSTGLRRSFEPDASIYAGDRPYPARVAWLGRTGVLRHQRYVELHLAPLRLDPSIGGLRLARALEVTVHFDGAPVEATLPRHEPTFEPVYAGSFANYEQGRSFRLTRTARFMRPSEASRAPEKAASRVNLPRHKILVRKDGMLRLDYLRIVGTGFEDHPMSSWRLINRGEEIPLGIRDDGDGWIEPGEWVQFYAEALLGEPKAVLNTDFDGVFEDLYEARDFSDENVYFLEVAEAPVPPMPERDAAPTHVRTPPLTFQATVHVEEDDAYRPTGLGDDPWYWLPSLIATGAPVRRSEPVPLPGLFSANETLQVRVNLLGVSEDADVAPDHLVRITLRNAADDALASFDGAFDGRTVHLEELSFSPGGGGLAVSDPIEVELEVLTGEFSRNDVILDYIEVDYRRGFEATSDRLEFSWPDEDAEFVVSGLSNATPEIWELTRPAGSPALQPVRLLGAESSGAGPYSVRFRIDQDPDLPDGTPRRFVVAGQTGASSLSGANFPADDVSDLRDNGHQADLVVIAHPDLLDDAPGSPLAELLAFRATPAGGGLTSKIVRLDDLYDEFYDGLSGPQAIREFLRWVLSDAPGEGWAEPKPSHVLLIGDGSYDYKAGTALGNYVPTQVMFKQDPTLAFYASDNVMGAVIGDDQLTDVVIGRIPSRSTLQVNQVLQKILDYEAYPDLEGTWRGHALFISDRGTNTGEGDLDFELTNSKAAALLCSEGETVNPTACPGDTPFTYRHLRYYSDYYTNPEVTSPREAMRGDIKDAVNGLDGVANGAVLLQYNGHGNYVVWSNDAFFDQRPPLPGQDINDLNNGGRLPWVQAHNCLTGGFHVTQAFSMGEDWFQYPWGGAIGVFSPSGLSYNYVGQVVSEIVWTELFGPRKERRVAVATLRAMTQLCAQGSIEPCQGYVLLGDPAQRLALPSSGTPVGLTALGGNARVELDWQAAPDAAPGTVYDVFRTKSLQPNLISYQRLNGEPLGETAFLDEDVTNTETYHYYVVATDPDGYRSRWSNFNSDCAVDGPDCVRATPLNPDPPGVPTGLAVNDPGLGSQLALTWNPNPEDDLLRYTIEYGTESGLYTSTLEVGLGTHVFVPGLAEGLRYYFALSATNTSGHTSALSDEVSDYPVYAPGLRPPAWIDSLRVRTAGTDVVLEWDQIDTDVYGKPTPLAAYEILRGTPPDYSNGGLVKIAECAAPCGTWTDPGAAVAPESYHYRVRARDARSILGALGSEYPDGTLLRVEHSASVPGGIRLSWRPVTETVRGGALDLLHYRVLASDQPFGIVEALAGSVPVLAATTETFLELPPPAGTRYYSVLVVDVRGNVSPF